MTHHFEILNRSFNNLISRMSLGKKKRHVLLIEAFLVGAGPGVILTVWYRTVFGHLSS